MSLSDRVAPHIPYLRRYARALSGSQKSGDNYAAVVLEALIDDPNILGEEGNDKRKLYALLTRLWTSVDTSSSATTVSAEWERNLQAVAPIPRQALLLTTVEGFSNDDAAYILGIERDEIEDHLDQATQSIQNQIATEVLVIEDEPLISLDIEQLVTSLGHKVVGIARTHGEAVELAEKTRPGLVLADIQLADGSSGIEAVNEILGEFSVPVIFITAFPERLLTGERPEPAYLITKPFEPETVKALISQSLFFQEKSVAAA